MDSDEAKSAAGTGTDIVSCSTPHTEQTLPPLPSTLPEYDNAVTENGEIEDIIDQMKTEIPVTTEANDYNQDIPTIKTDPSVIINEEQILLSKRKKSTKKYIGKEALETTREYQRRHFSDEPPISLSTTTFQLQNFISSTTQFINSYVANSSAKLDEFSDKLDRLERQICILESKKIVTSNPDIRDD